MSCISLSLLSMDNYRVVWSESDAMKQRNRKKIMSIIDIQNLNFSNKVQIFGAVRKC